jgi:hypothetical protein
MVGTQPARAIARSGRFAHPTQTRSPLLATPKLTWTKAGPAENSGPAGQPYGHRGSPTQNIENNPMQSSLAVAGMRDLAKTFDTSGKSPAIFHHRAICKTQTNLAPASWRLDHTASPTATLSLVLHGPLIAHALPAAQWHDGQIVHGRHARFARRAIGFSMQWTASFRIRVPNRSGFVPPPSLRAQRSNPDFFCGKSWVASLLSQ